MQSARVLNNNIKITVLCRYIKLSFKNSLHLTVKLVSKVKIYGNRKGDYKLLNTKGIKAVYSYNNKSCKCIMHKIKPSFSKCIPKTTNLWMKI